MPRPCGRADQEIDVARADLLQHLRLLAELRPGDAVHLPAGNLHAYLAGAGVELMASSDNVLRGGLTPKHVDVPELLRVLDFRAGPVAIVHPAPPEEEQVYLTPAPEFRLSRFLLDGLGVNFYFGGTSLLIVVGVAMDTVNQIEAQLIMRHYEGFTPRAGRIRGRRSG